MLLEAAMSELREDSADMSELIDEEDMSSLLTRPNGIQGQKLEGRIHLNGNLHSMKYISAVEEPKVQSNFPNAAILSDPPHPNGQVSLSPDDHSPANYAADESSMSNAGPVCNDGGISLLHDDNEFASRILNREPSNLGESSRFGSYRSTAAVAASGVPFQWEAQPGKSKINPSIIKEEEEEQQQQQLIPPLSLPPIRLSNSKTHMPPPAMPSPSSSTSAAPSPRSLTEKMKSLIIKHVQKPPSMDHFSFTSILEPQKSPLKRSPSSRSRRERMKASSLSASEYGSLKISSATTSPSIVYSSHLKNGNMQRNEEPYAVPRASLNSVSDPCSSPYYFSPLSNTSSRISPSGSIMSPRPSIAQRSSSGSIISHSSTHAHHVGLHTSSQAGSADSSISSVSGTGAAPGTPPSSNRPAAMLANCLLSITSMSNEHLGRTESENGDQNGSNSLSFASPEMEVIDDELLTSENYVDSMDLYSKPETTIADFINRGGPAMNRSFSTSRVTFADDLNRKLSPKSKYYSGQLSNLAQPKSAHHPSAMRDHVHCTANNLDVLFPLKRPNASGVKPVLAKSLYQSEESPDDRQAYADALDTSLDSSVMTDSEELNSMVQSIMNDQIMKERPAHEVVIEANDENGFAYSPVASAFVFSPKKASQNATTAGAMGQYFKPPTRANPSNDAGSINHRYNYRVSNSGQPKSILKKTNSHELTSGMASFNAQASRCDLPALVNSAYARQKSFPHSGPLKSDDSSVDVHPAPLYGVQPTKSLMPSGSQKISSVLLRFAEAEEQLYHSSKRHHGSLRSPAACMQPMCSFLGRALLCRSKLTSHAGSLQT